MPQLGILKKLLHGVFIKFFVIHCFLYADAVPLLWWVIPAVAFCMVIFLIIFVFCCCRRRAGKYGKQINPLKYAINICCEVLIHYIFLLLRDVLRRHPAVHPERVEFYQDRMPLYINCTEVTHIYTNGSYQLVYQNCTPLFVHTNQVLEYLDLSYVLSEMEHCTGENLSSYSVFWLFQIRPIGRRGGERRRGRNRRAGLGVSDTRDAHSGPAADAETAIYLEVLWLTWYSCYI